MLTGRCACRAVGYDVEDAFVVAYNCHCSNCRAMSGSAFLAWGEIEPEKFRFTRGTEALSVEGDPQSIHATRCRECSSLLCWTVHYNGRTWLRVPYGTLDGAPTLAPTAHMFVGSKAEWYEINDELPQHAAYPW